MPFLLSSKGVISFTIVQDLIDPANAHSNKIDHYGYLVTSYNAKLVIVRSGHTNQPHLHTLRQLMVISLVEMDLIQLPLPPPTSAPRVSIC